MDYAVVENGVVTNVIVASENYVHLSEGKAIPSSEAQIGWTYKDGKFSPPIIDEEKNSLSSERAKTDASVESMKER